MKKKFWLKALSFLVALSFIIGMLPVTAFAGTNGYTDSATGKDKYIVFSTDYAIAKGVTETDVVGNEQVMGYMLQIDFAANKDLKLKATYTGYYNGTDSSAWSVSKWGLSTTSSQAAAYENATGENVIFATNGDYFNMQTGQPSGPLIMNGVQWNPQKAAREPFFAVLKDGSCVIRPAGSATDDVVEAIGGPFLLVDDGKNVAPGGTEPYPVNCVGFKADGTVVFFLADGRQFPRSVGMTQHEQADFLIAQGVVKALYLDGGGSATFMTEREGDDTQAIRNSPSDGSERSISSGLLLVSTAAPDGTFDHAVLSPNNNAYTPGASVEFSYLPVDAAGSVATTDIPETLTWSLTEDSAALGSIDAATGVFTSNGATGTVTVNLTDGSTVVGSTSVDILEPTEIYFNAASTNLDFGEKSTLDFSVRADGRDLDLSRPRV